MELKLSPVKASFTRTGLGLAALGAGAVALWPVAPSTFNPEKALAFATALCVWIFSEFYNHGFKDSAPTVVGEHDRALMKKLYEVADDQHIQFLKRHDLGTTWQRRWLEPSYELENELQKVTSEFEDSDLQAEALKLRGRTSEFVDFMAMNSWPLHGELVSMITDRERSMDEISERTRQRVAKANNAADKVAESLEELYRLARHKGIVLHDVPGAVQSPG